MKVADVLIGFALIAFVCLFAFAFSRKPAADRSIRSIPVPDKLIWTLKDDKRAAEPCFMIKRSEGKIIEYVIRPTACEQRVTP